MLLEDDAVGKLFHPVEPLAAGHPTQQGRGRMVRIPYPYTEWTQIHAFPYEYVPTDLDISPDGRLRHGE